MEGNKLGKETENDEIRQFLQDVKTLLSANRYDFVPRKRICNLLPFMDCH